MGDKLDNMTILATVHVVAMTSRGAVNDVFQQTLTAPLGHDTLQWIEKLDSARQGAIDQQQLVTNSLMGLAIGQMRIVFGSAAVAFFLVFMVLASLNLVAKTAPASADIQTALFARKHKGMIVDVDALSEPETVETVISVSEFEELVKVAITLPKPILHYSGDAGHTYCVVDGSVRYQFALKADSASGTTPQTT